MKTQKYFTLIGFAWGRWEIIFGDFEREVVEQELEDTKDAVCPDIPGDYQKFKILTSADAQKAVHGIDAAVKKLNDNLFRKHSDEPVKS